MFREQARKRLAKKAKKGFRGFPVAAAPASVKLSPIPVRSADQSRASGVLTFE